MSSESPIILPVVTVQPTIGEVVQEVQEGIIPYEKFWVSLYKTSETSIHAKINAELDNFDRNLVRLTSENDGISASPLGTSGYEYAISCPALGISDAHVLLPRQEYSDPERANPRRPQRIEAFDVSPDNSRFAVGFLDGTVSIYPTSAFDSKLSFVPQKIQAKPRTYARPHLSSLTSLKFFPSSRVLLTSGVDFSLAILPADLPDSPNEPAQKVAPVRTLRAHTRSVTNTAIVPPGRNVLSASLDSTLKLWDVPSGSVISSLSLGSPILSMSTGARVPEIVGNVDVAGVSKDEREMSEVSSQMAVTGHQDGSFQVCDLASKKAVYRSSPGIEVPLQSITYSASRHLLATGTNSGLVTIYDVRSLKTPITSFIRQQTEISDLKFFPERSDRVRLAVSTTDGLPFIASIVDGGVVFTDELVGVDCDPVRHIRARGAQQGWEIWSASDDAVVRRYLYQKDP